MREFVLDNGLKILLLEDHKSPAVTFQVWYRVGSRNEKDGKSGLSHFLEHMMFKGTQNGKARRVFADYREKWWALQRVHDLRRDGLFCHHEPRQDRH